MVAVLVKAHAGNNPYARPEGAAEVATGMGHCVKNVQTHRNRCRTVSKLEGKKLDEERLECATICVKSKPICRVQTHILAHAQKFLGELTGNWDQENQGPRGESRRVETDFMCY